MHPYGDDTHAQGRPKGGLRGVGTKSRCDRRSRGVHNRGWNGPRCGGRRGRDNDARTARNGRHAGSPADPSTIYDSHPSHAVVNDAVDNPYRRPRANDGAVHRHDGPDPNHHDAAVCVPNGRPSLDRAGVYRRTAHAITTDVPVPPVQRGGHARQRFRTAASRWGQLRSRLADSPSHPHVSEADIARLERAPSPLQIG